MSFIKAVGKAIGKRVVQNIKQKWSGGGESETSAPSTPSPSAGEPAGSKLSIRKMASSYGKFLKNKI